MVVQVVLNLEVDTDLESVSNIVDRVNWDALLGGDDVINVTSVEVENFQIS